MTAEIVGYEYICAHVAQTVPRVGRAGHTKTQDTRTEGHALTLCSRQRKAKQECQLQI